MPSWNYITPFPIHKTRISSPRSIKALAESKDDLERLHLPIAEGVAVKLRVDSVFEQGSTRLVRMAQEEGGAESDGLVLYKHYITEGGARRFTPQMFDQSDWQNVFYRDLAGHNAASFLAEQFNAVVGPLGLPRVSYVTAFVSQVHGKLPVSFGHRPFFLVEGIVPGEWEKYNSNNGYVAPNPSPPGVDHSAVQAFSHWTHHATAGRLMVVDCQGSYDPRTNAFTLADPAVLCLDPSRFGCTNVGQEGMARFFSTHTCNACCRQLGISH